MEQDPESQFNPAMPFFSIIIPVKQINDYVIETVAHIQNLDRGDWETFIVTNEPEKSLWNDERVILLSSGRAGPASKRDLASVTARGEVLVFLDDDSYPSTDLLDVLFFTFEQGAVAVGGPAITPPEDNFWQQVSGAVFLSRLSGGSPERVIPRGDVHVVDDWPTVNLSIRRRIFRELGGFDCVFWPGEDTFLCDKMTRAGHQILYTPEAKVWHHRRATLSGHLKQIGGYGLHRGYFARNFPESSRRLSYFLPSVLPFLLLLTIVLALFRSTYTVVPLAFLAVYLLVVFGSMVSISRKVANRIAVSTFPYIVLTHFWYGIRFLLGFFKPGPLVSKLR